MKRNKKLLIWTMLLSALFIGLASKSSPLYPMNDWVDINCFFTMGRGILDGLVPYRDLYEQKGPILYFVFAFIALFSRDSYIGVYLLEVLTFGLFLYFSGKLAQLYLGKSRTVYILVAVLAAAVVTSWSFTHGGSVEQHSLFMLVYGMYSVLRALRESRPLSFREAFLNGIFAGILFWVKYTILGFYMGLALFVLLWYLTNADLRKKLLAAIGQFLLGVIAVTVPVLVYFGIFGATDDLFTAYFYNNIFLYSDQPSDSRLKALWDCIKLTIKYNTNWGWLIWSGSLFLLLKRPGQWKAGLMTLLCFGFLTLTTYWGGKPWDYYGLVFAAFCIIGLLVWTELLRATRLFTLWHRLLPRHWISAAVTLSIVLSVLLAGTLQFNQNLYLAKYSKEETVQYRFAKTIQTVEDATLLNYGFLDGGFYFASEASPACRYFCTFNVNPGDMWTEHNACIQKGETDFIVTRDYQLEQYGIDCSKYQLVDSFTHPFQEKVTFTYYLYQLIF